MSVETDIAEIKADMRHLVKLGERNDKALHGDDGCSGIVADVKRHNDAETKINRLVASVVALLLANVGTLIKLLWNSLKG